MLSNRLISLAALAGGLISVLLSFVFGSWLLAVISAIFFTLSIFLWKYGYLFIPFLTRATNIVEIRGNYEVPPTRDHIIKKAEGGYYATKFME
ncbi:hypothetical protein HZC08_01225, partial [Candidatus Micrarchaeota archaeon]|nr:hypothetical protein [Candidatus Micrarchaeota archaeon]